MPKLILRAPSVAAVVVAGPPADAFSNSRFCPRELDPIPVSGYEAHQPD
jgi:hypothetical protein